MTDPNADRIRRNALKMRAGGASDDEIEAYLASEDGEDGEDFSDVSDGASSSARIPGKVPFSVRDHVVRPALQGVTQGFSDELRGAFSMPIGDDADMRARERGDSRSVTEQYTGERDRERRALANAREDWPKTAIASEVGGGLVAPGVGYAKVAKGTPLLLRALAGFGAGATGGAVYGAGTSEGGEGEITPLSKVADDAGRSGVIGGAAGAVLPVGWAGVKKVAQAPRRSWEVVKGVGNVARGNFRGAVGNAARAFTAAPKPVPAAIKAIDAADDLIPILRESPGVINTVDDLIPLLRPGATSTEADDVLRMLGPRRLGGSPTAPPVPVRPPQPAPERLGLSPEDYAAARAEITAPSPAPRNAEGFRINQRDWPDLPPLQATASAPPRADAIVSDDPLIQAMAAQVARGKPPTPRVSQARGPEPKVASKAAPPSSKPPKGGKGTRAYMEWDARRRGWDPDAMRAESQARADRKSYGSFMEKHSQGSAQRRGELAFDARVNADAKAQMDALQQQADAAPDEETREVLYRAWKKLKDEFGRANAGAVAGAGAAAGGALTAALAARKSRP